VDRVVYPEGLRYGGRAPHARDFPTASGIGADGDHGDDGSSTAGPAHLTQVASSHGRPVAGDTGNPLSRR